jgi:integrase
VENQNSAGVAESGPISLRSRTVNVIVRHSADCKDKAKGGDWRKCNCPKALLIYEGEGSGKNRRVSAKTRSWEKAESERQKILDSWDPEKVELKQLRAKKLREQVRVEDAVALYIKDQIRNLGDNGTVRMIRSLLGHVDEKGTVVSNGRLFNWLDTLLPDARPTYIAEFSPAHITAWRASWDFDSDLTAANRWRMVKGFFQFCEAQGWVADNPARKLKRLAVKKGSRTSIFTDDQYQKILDAVALYDPDNVPEQTRKAWKRRVEIFIELLRWSGMALIDGIQYRPEKVNDGVLTYKRQKSGELATVPLPKHLLKMLHNIPLERDSVGPSEPFRTKGTALASDTRKWEHRLSAVFKLAGITEVRNEVGRLRPPHPHMLRDTFAVWHLRHGARLHTVSKMLGHSKTATTERSYLPWVVELQEAHIADARRSLAHLKKS